MRMGKKKQPTYRVVAADARSPRDGRFIEIVGHYNPRTDPSSITVDNDKAVAWLQKGAQPTETVEKLLKISGAWEQFTGEPVPGQRVCRHRVVSDVADDETTTATRPMTTSPRASCPRRSPCSSTSSASWSTTPTP